ncbi:MAG: hypothetical protein WDN23_01300 [Edaphobacter sp.]
MQRIVASGTFNKALRLSNFLSYVCERQLLGRTDELTEHQIGIHVFGRPTDYNPGDDNIVRASARLLRQRLMQYFHEDGALEPEWIVIPRGAYVPVFERRPQPVAVPPVQLAILEESQPDAVLVHEPQEQEKLRLRHWIWLLAAALGLLVVAAFFVLPRMRQTPADRLWATIFPRGGTTLFIAGDSALVMLQNMTHHSVSISAYSAGNYIDIDKQTAEASEQLIRNLGQRRYTSIADLRLASSFAALAKTRNNTLDVRYAREITTDTLKRGTLILSGDPQGNPWVELFDKDLNFRFSMDDASAIHIVHNMHPLPGESVEYRSFGDDPQHRAYALIALLHSLDGEGHVLLIEGTTMAGLEAAQDFLFSSGTLSQVLRPAVERDGLHNFEILLESKNIAAKASGFQVIATRIH